jgi:polyribonucleotide nucleotidyltransferase
VLYGKPGRSSSAQKTKMLQVDPADIGKIIGKGGETVRGLIADHGLANVDVDDDGCVTITGSDEAQVDACAARIAELVDVDLGR